MGKKQKAANSTMKNAVGQSDKAYYDSAYEELLEGGFSEAEIKKWFVYSSEQKAFIPTPEYQKRMDNIRRLREKEENLYLEAVEAGIGELYQSAYILKKKAQQCSDWEYDEQQQSVNQDGTEVKVRVQEEWKAETESHQNRMATLDMLGLHPYPTGIDYQSFTYTLYGYEYKDCETLYHYDKLIGIFFDERFSRGPKLSRQEHISRLLKIALDNKLRLVLVYWENEDKPVWEVYVHTIFVRKQSNPYSYDGLVFDEEKLHDMNQIIKDAKGGGIDIGRTQQLLLQRIVDAPKRIVNRKELEVRIEENVRQHGELADLVSLMQVKSTALSQAVQKMSVNGDISEEEQQKAYDLLDAYTDSLPQVSIMDFKKRARKYYGEIFDSLSPSSQMYLTTATALESVITDEKYDICPIYAELGRVFENELDLRIFAEYIRTLLTLHREDKIDYAEKIKSDPFRNIRLMLSRVKKDNVNQKLFVPEANKLKTLPELLSANTNSSSVALPLNEILERYGYRKESLCSSEQNSINQDFVATRNEHTHPNPNMNMEQELMNLEMFKQRTVARLAWLVGATQHKD